MGTISTIKDRCKNCEFPIKKQIQWEFDKYGNLKPIWLKQECECISRSVSIEAIKDGYDPIKLKWTPNSHKP